MEVLSQFIQDNPDPRELKRALAVQMVLHDMGKSKTICRCRLASSANGTLNCVSSERVSKALALEKTR